MSVSLQWIPNRAGLYDIQHSRAIPRLCRRIPLLRTLSHGTAGNRRGYFPQLHPRGCVEVHFCTGVVIKQFTVTAFTVLLLGISALLLFIGGGSVSTDSGPIMVEVQAADRQDTHFSYYQEHLARAQMSTFYCH